MKYALIGSQYVEPSKGAKATCPLCGSTVIAKCGSYRVNHWAHKGLKDCDIWAEGETEWHRTWKDKFPREYQEFTQRDQQSGEIHRADVRTNHGLVIEFQHSHLDPQERDKRERFYGNMVWVVNGTRLKTDYSRFLKGKDNLRGTNVQGFFLMPRPDDYFPADWIKSSVPVFFDFLGLVPSDPSEPARQPLWCLLPGRAEGYAVVVAALRESFLEAVSKGPYIFFQAPARETVNVLAEAIRKQNAMARAQAERNFQQLAYRPLGRRHFRL
jgi:hypothetical protein